MYSVGAGRNQAHRVSFHVRRRSWQRDGDQRCGFMRESYHPFPPLPVQRLWKYSQYSGQLRPTDRSRSSKIKTVLGCISIPVADRRFSGICLTPRCSVPPKLSSVKHVHDYREQQEDEIRTKKISMAYWRACSLAPRCHQKFNVREHPHWAGTSSASEGCFLTRVISLPAASLIITSSADGCRW